MLSATGEFAISRTNSQRFVRIFEARIASHHRIVRPAAWIASVLLIPLSLVFASERTSVARNTKTSGVSVPPPSDVQGFVRDVLHNEVEAQMHDQSLWFFTARRFEGGKEKSLNVSQTKYGEIERLVAINGKPLSASELQAEDHRIANLLSHPSQLRQKLKKLRADAELARHLLKIFPDAFRFHCEGTEGSLVKLKFMPNSNFHPSGHTEQAVQYLEGTLILDARAKRLATINGVLTRDVKFAGGLLGHLEKGGTFSVQQQEVAPGYWEGTLTRVQMKGKALLFKTIAVQVDETYTNFRLLTANTTLQSAAELVSRDQTYRSASLN
jgi:hypothetical protein